MLLRQPAQDLASSDSHALTRRSDQALVKVTNQYFFNHVPGVVRSEQPFDIVGVENLKRLFEQLHDFHTQHVQVAERQPLKVVAQVEPGTPHYCNGPEARIVGTFADHSTLFFYRGRDLDDGSGLLQGSGKDTRFVTLRSASDAERPEVKRLIRNAIKVGGSR